MTTRQPFRRRRLAAALLAVLIVGCGRDVPSTSVSDSMNPVPGAVTPPPAPAGAASSTDRVAVEAVYRQFWILAQQLASSYPVAQWRVVLARVATEPLLTRVVDGLRTQVAAGSRPYGTVVPHPTMIDIIGGRATMLDCQDASRSGDADATTELPENVGRSRTPIAATIRRIANGQWRVSDARYLDGQC